MSPFIYKDSINEDQVRILTVLPADGDQSIKCLLTTELRSDCKGEYDALSYCWGSKNPGETNPSETNPSETDPSETIYVNGAECQVGKNLADALHALRLMDEPPRTWVDAICINQSMEATNAEKNLQVQTMGRTYGECARAIVWLGCALEEENSALAVKAIGALGRQFEGSLNATQKTMVHAPLDFTNVQYYLANASNIRSVAGTLGVLSQTQEWLVNTRHLFHVRDEDLLRTAGNQSQNIETIREQNCRLLSHLWNTRQRSCTKAKDRIYALQGITLDVEVTVDYNLTDPEVFTNATRAIIEKHEHLDVLFMCHGQPAIPSQDPAFRPSWVPDFGTSPDPQTNFCMLRPLTVQSRSGSDFAQFTATGNSRVDTAATSDPQRFRLYGYDLGVIDTVQQLKWNRGIQEAWQHVRAKLAGATHGAAREALSQTMIADRNSRGALLPPDTNHGEFETWWDAVNDLVTAGGNPDEGNEFERWWRKAHNIATAPDRLQEASHYNETYWSHGHLRMLYTTDGGYFGHSRPTIESGDHVCLLAGGQTPFILREYHGDVPGLQGEKFQLVSEAYVYGIMDGSLWSKYDTEGTPKQEFVLF